MPILFDKDERAVNELIKSNPVAFNPNDMFAVVDVRTAITNLILDARIEERIKYTHEKQEVAEAAIIKELEATKR